MRRSTPNKTIFTMLFFAFLAAIFCRDSALGAELDLSTPEAANAAYEAAKLVGDAALVRACTVRDPGIEKSLDIVLAPEREQIKLDQAAQAKFGKAAQARLPIPKFNYKSGRFQVRQQSVWLAVHEAGVGPPQVHV